jgi:hypothetical protein
MSDWIEETSGVKPVTSSHGYSGRNEKPVWSKREAGQHGRSAYGYLAHSWQIAYGLCPESHYGCRYARNWATVAMHDAGVTLALEIKRRRATKSVQDHHARTYTSVYWRS